jgi:glycosyltransferase involved in cell wall biosynthesis
VLFVAAHLPVPVRGGSSQRTHLLIEALSKFVDVELAPIGNPGVRRLLEDNGYRVAFVIPPESDGLLRRLARVALPGSHRFRPLEEPSRLLQEAWDSGRYALAIGRYLGPSARAGVHCLPGAIVDVDDLDSQKLRSWASGHRLGRWLALPVGLLSKHMAVAERAILARLSRVWVSASEDARNIAASETDLVPNIPFNAPERVENSVSNGHILFVASLDYRVNVNALGRFVGTVWPEVRRLHPTLTLRVVGGGLSADKAASLAAVPGVELAGFVDDLAAEYRGAAFSVVPIWEGGGTKIKVLESLAHGRACVVAGPSMRGYHDHLKHGTSVLIAQNDDEFAGQMGRLLTDIELRHQMEAHGLRVVTECYSREGLAGYVRSSLEASLGTRLES